MISPPLQCTHSVAFDGLAGPWTAYIRPGAEERAGLRPAHAATMHRPVRMGSAAAFPFVVILRAIRSAWLSPAPTRAARGSVPWAARHRRASLRLAFESGESHLVSQVVSRTEPGSADSRALVAWAGRCLTPSALTRLRATTWLAPTRSVTLRPYLTRCLQHAGALLREPGSGRPYLLRATPSPRRCHMANHERRSRHLRDHLHLFACTARRCPSLPRHARPPLAKAIVHAS